MNLTRIGLAWCSAWSLSLEENLEEWKWVVDVDDVLHLGMHYFALCVMYIVGDSIKPHI